MIKKDAYLENPCGISSLPYWKSNSIIIPDYISVVHKNDFKSDIYENMNISRYFRLVHNLKLLPTEDKDILQINFEEDLEELVSMINQSYKHEGINVTKEEVISWTKRPVYERHLWVKIITEGRIIASGIADFDHEIKEGIIEWVQVLPSYQHQGYGKRIVNALLLALSNKASFVTVSGNLDNQANPDSLYRSCGFVGNDIWYICKRI